MSKLPSKAKCVVIGAGIVGNGMVYHLAKLGWKDIVQIDKGPLPNPGGSTGHASNFIFPVDHSKEMTAITAESMRQYKEFEHLQNLVELKLLVLLSVCKNLLVALLQQNHGASMVVELFPQQKLRNSFPILMKR
jgi:glycine/D-amino acid oxidase-like deaminating enzyme